MIAGGVAFGDILLPAAAKRMQNAAKTKVLEIAGAASGG